MNITNKHRKDHRWYINEGECIDLDVITINISPTIEDYDYEEIGDVVFKEFIFPDLKKWCFEDAVKEIENFLKNQVVLKYLNIVYVGSFDGYNNLEGVFLYDDYILKLDCHSSGFVSLEIINLKGCKTKSWMW